MATRRVTVKQAQAALAAQAPPPSDTLDYPVRTAHVGWLDVEAELPRLLGWMSEHNTEAFDIAERIRIGHQRRLEALGEQPVDQEVLAAIDDRLSEYRAKLIDLDYGARRALVVHALLYLRDVAGPCAVAVSAAGGKVEISVR